MEIAKSCDYAIRGLLYLAQQPNPFEPVLLREIAARANAPEAFMSKVFQSLRASNLVVSHRGKRRGYSLAKQPSAISLYDIIVAVEGPSKVRSTLPSRHGSDLLASFHTVWAEIEEKVIEEMKATTLWTILERRQNGRA